LAWQAVETIRCVQKQIGDRTRLCAARASRRASAVLKILRLTELDPPAPSTGQETRYVVARVQSRPHVCKGLQAQNANTR
jgi:hypothetical protein